MSVYVLVNISNDKITFIEFTCFVVPNQHLFNSVTFADIRTYV